MRRLSPDSRPDTPDRCPVCGTRYERKHSARHRIVLQDETADPSVRNDRLDEQLCERCWQRLQARLRVVEDPTRN